MNVVNVESLKKTDQDDNETVHDDTEKKIVVGVLLPRKRSGEDVVAKEHGVTHRHIVLKIPIFIIFII